MFESLRHDTFSMPICMIGILDSRRISTLRNHLETLGMIMLEQHFDFLDVAATRELTQGLSQQSEKKICLFYTLHRTNIESQNTLLKTLEDYGGTTPLIFNIPHADIFLPTIMSRCFVLDIRSSQEFHQDTGVIDWEVWFQSDIDKRLDIIGKANKAETLIVPVLQEGIDFLERKFYADFLDNHANQNRLIHIQKIRQWIQSPNPSVVMIGEYMSLIL